MDVILKNIRALEACGQLVQSWDTLLIALIVSKFEFIVYADFEYLLKSINVTIFTTSTKYQEHDAHSQHIIFIPIYKQMKLFMRVIEDRIASNGL